ncbi:MAG: MgtC/SapB family protein [Paludibacteraceae bacterium]|nr:MgtC/SapB family protein [Paludibacteraceae bacterium]
MNQIIEQFLQTDWIGVVTKIGMAIVLGYLIGVERELHGKVVGTRTVTLIAIGTTMYVLMSPTITGGDNSRVIAQVVSGIGFLGAGIIFKDGDTVKGLTTAATVWCAAAIGGLCGFGMFAEAVLGTIAIVAVNIFFRHRLSKLEKEEKSIKKEK